MTRETGRLSGVELPILRSWLAWASVVCAIMSAALYHGGMGPVAALAFAALGVICVGGFAVLALIAPWTTRPPRAPDESVDLPRWAWTLREERRAELEEILRGHQRNALLAREAATEARSRAGAAQLGLWAVIDRAAAAEEHVRGRMVAELHDGVAQMLVVSAYLAEDEDVTREKLREHLVQTEVELRDVMTFALPPQLRDGSLGQSVRYLSDTLALRRDLVVQWDWPQEGDTMLNEAVALTLYRFFQEALSNTAKHAGVDKAYARLRFEDADRIVAEVEDEGAGFILDEVDVGGHGGHHIGLAMMRERAGQVGARVSVDTAPGEGTLTTLTVPGPPAGVPRPIPVGTLD